MKPLDVILKNWNDNKGQNLFKLLGEDKLIISRPYSYLSQPEALSMKIDKHLQDEPCRAFMFWYNWKVCRNALCDIEITDTQGVPLINKKDYFYSKWYPISDCLTPLALATNAYMGNDCIVHFPKSGKSMKLFKGMKPMKIIHRIVQEYDGDEQLFEAFRTWHSMQLNQKRMDGELCLSIHPLDFMTMSDNANDWKSCMRWGSWSSYDTCLEQGHGDYCAGTIQCMNSPYIIVAYLHNPDHKFYPFYMNKEYEWNSKQWRELFIVRDGVINEIKGYPFQDENLTNACLMWIKELAAKNLGWTYNNEEVDVSRVIDYNNDEDILLDYYSGMFMYKDIGTLPKHSGRINPERLLKNKTHNKIGLHHFVDIDYGGEATCMSCGAPLDDTENSDKLMCETCDPSRHCYWCGETISSDDTCYYVDGNAICEDCYEDHCATDAFSDEIYFYEDLDPVYLLLGYDKHKESVYYDNPALVYAAT